MGGDKETAVRAGNSCKLGGGWAGLTLHKQGDYAALQSRSPYPASFNRAWKPLLWSAVPTYILS